MPGRFCPKLLLTIAVLSTVAAGRSASGGQPAAVGPSLAQLALHEYAYVDFLRRLQAINDEIELVELTIAYWTARVENYRPMRSFGRYAATYTADRSARLQLLAAHQELACLVRDKGDLWRERQAIAQAALFDQIDQKSQPR